MILMIIVVENVEKYIDVKDIEDKIRKVLGDEKFEAKTIKVTSVEIFKSIYNLACEKENQKNYQIEKENIHK